MAIGVAPDVVSAALFFLTHGLWPPLCPLGNVQIFLVKTPNRCRQILLPRRAASIFSNSSSDFSESFGLLGIVMTAEPVTRLLVTDAVERATVDSAGHILYAAGLRYLDI